jgi:hypothetical protein
MFLCGGSGIANALVIEKRGPTSMTVNLQLTELTAIVGASSRGRLAAKRHNNEQTAGR